MNSEIIFIIIYDFDHLRKVSIVFLMIFKFSRAFRALLTKNVKLATAMKAVRSTYDKVDVWQRIKIHVSKLNKIKY